MLELMGRLLGRAACLGLDGLAPGPAPVAPVVPAAPPPPPPPPPPPAEPGAIFAVQGQARDALQAAALSHSLPPEAQGAIQGINDACDRLKRKLEAKTPIAADDPDLQAVATQAAALKTMLQEAAAAAAPPPAPAPPEKDDVVIKERAERIIKLADGYTNTLDEKQILATFRECQNPAEVSALLDRLGEQGWNYEKLFGEMDSDDHRMQFLQLTEPAMSQDQKAAAIKQFAEGITTGNDEHAMAFLVASERTHTGQQELLGKLDKQGIGYDRLIGEMGDKGVRLDSTQQLYKGLEARGVPLTVEGMQKELLAGIPAMERDDAEAQLEAIAARGKLTPELLGQLLALQTPEATPLKRDWLGFGDEILSRQALVRETLADLGDPSRISQGQWGTCGATRVQMALALNDPDRYAEMVRLLASPSGDASAMIPGVVRPSDQKLTRATDVVGVGNPHVDGKVVAESLRTVTTALLSPALMNYAGEGAYSNRNDRHLYNPLAELIDGKEDHGGTSVLEGKRTLEATTGIRFDVASGPGEFGRIQEAARHGPVPIDMDWSDGGHAVMFVGTAKDAAGNDVALLLNPWGHQHTMPLDDFKSRIRVGLIPQEGQPPLERPTRAFDLSTYTPLEDKQHLNYMEVLERSPGYKALDADVRQALDMMVLKNGIHEGFIQDRLRPMIASGHMNTDDVKRLDGVIDKHGQRAGAFLGMQLDNYMILDKQAAFRALDPDLQKRALDLLAKKDLDDVAANQIGALAAAGKLTPELVAQLENDREPAGLLARAAAGLPPAPGPVAEAPPGPVVEEPPGPVKENPAPPPGPEAEDK